MQTLPVIVLSRNTISHCYCVQCVVEDIIFEQLHTKKQRIFEKKQEKYNAHLWHKESA